jgi:hypothetical protein
MSKNNNKAKNSELDFVSPIVETITPIVEEGMKIIATLIQFLLKNFFNMLKCDFLIAIKWLPLKLGHLNPKRRVN